MLLASAVTEPDPSLVSAARAGDPAAFDALFLAAAGRVLVFARAHLGPALAAELDEEDVLQDVYLAARAAVPAFHGADRRAFQAWLCALTANRLADRGRRAARAPRAADAAWTRWLALARDPRTGPLTSAARRDSRAAVAAALDALPDEERQALLAHLFEGRTQAELAVEFGTSTSTVQRRIATGLAAVGRALRLAQEGGAL